MKKNLLFLLFSIIFNSIFSQCYDWEWVKSADSYNIKGKGITIDNEGNIFVAGLFETDSINFDSITVFKKQVSFGDKNLFYVKYDKNGNVLWANSFCSKLYELKDVTDITSDNEGNIFISGSYYKDDTLYIGQDTLYSKEELISSTYSNDHFFVAKIDSNGNALWGINSSGNNGQRIHDVYCDKYNNLFIAGMFTGNYMDISDNTIYRKSNYGDMFFAKYDSEGNYLWCKNGGTGNTSNCYSITTDSEDNILVAGHTASNVEFDSISIGLSNNGNGTFLFKFDSIGNALWGKEPRGYMSNEYHVGNVCVITDKKNNVYLLNSLDGDCYIDGNTLYPTDIDCAYIVKFDQNGLYQWGTVLDTDYSVATGYIHYDGGKISIDRNDNIFVAPESAGLLIFGLNKDNGTIIWEVNTYGSYGPDKILSIDTDNNGDILATGFLQEKEMVFTNDISINRDSYGYLLFTAKLSSIKKPNLGIDTLLCAGNSLILDAGTFTSYLWNDNSTNATLNVNQTGKYFVKTTDQCGVLSDTINITVNTDQIDIGSDLYLSNEDSLNIIVPSGFNNYVWNDSITTDTLKIIASNYSTGIYTIKIDAKDNNGCHTSDSINIYLNTTNIKDPRKTNEFEVFPNPSYNYVNINTINSSIIKKIELYNLNGNLIYEDNLETGSIDLTSYNSGIYLLKVITSKNLYTYKIIKK